MKNSQAKRLSEELLNVDQKIIAEALEIDDAKKLKEYIKLNSKEAKKPFYITITFKRATAIAACLVIVAVTAFALTNKTNNNISSNNNANSDNISSNNTSSNNISFNNSGETSSGNKKVIYVTGDTPDEEVAFGNSIKKLSEKYISQKLQEKMDLYKDYTEAEVVYRVVVGIFIAQEDYDGADKVEEANKEVQSLYNQYLAAEEEVDKAEHELYIFNRSNKGSDPEIVEKRKELIAVCNEKEKNSGEIWLQWDNLRRAVRRVYYEEVRAKRLEFLKQFSEQELDTTLYDGYTHYFIDLTAQEINILAKKGGYTFRLSNEKPPIALPA